MLPESSSFRPATVVLDRRALLRAGLVVLGTAAAGSVLAACAPRGSTASPSGGVPVTGGTLVYATSLMTSLDSMDPALGENDGIYLLQGCIREGISYLDENYEVQPRLCTWDANADFTQYTLHVREGVTFHDGTSLTADDVAWMITRNLDEELGSSLYTPLTADLDPSGVTVVDPHTVQLDLKRSDSALMVQFARAAALIVPKGTTDFASGIGTGPFTLKSYQAGKGFDVVKNPDYWMPELPLLDGVQGLQIAEAATALQGVLAGSTHVTEIGYTSAPQLQGASGVQQVVYENSALLTAVMDQTQEPFTDERVRQALKHAVDRTKLVEGAFAGFGATSNDSAIAPDDAQYPTGLDDAAAYDPDTARSLLSEAGYPDGLSLTLETPSDDLHANFALAVAAATAGSGFDITVHQSDPDTYWSKVWQNTPFMVNDWNRRPATILLPLMFSRGAPWNDAKFDDDEFEASMAAAFASTGDAQAEAVQAAAERVQTLSGSVIPAWRHRVVAAKSTVTGLVYDSSTTFDLRETWISA